MSGIGILWDHLNPSPPSLVLSYHMLAVALTWDAEALARNSASLFLSIMTAI